MFYNVIEYMYIHGFQKDTVSRGECSKNGLLREMTNKRSPVQCSSPEELVTNW